MGNVDDASMTSSFEYVGDQTPQHRRNADDVKEESGEADVMSGIGGNLGKVVAGQVRILVIFRVHQERVISKFKNILMPKYSKVYTFSASKRTAD